ncbi:MAG: glycosyltransferase [Syntrophales bacterium]
MQESLKPSLSEEPLVSVLMLAYNHERYIAQAVEGALMQQVDFTYEIVIGEDCSTDGTRDLITGYGGKYNDRIRLLLQKRNAGMQKNFADTYRACRGRYIALLDGDDFWTDPHKLQKQVDYLEKNPDYAICFHNMQVLYEDDQQMNRLSNPNQQETTTLEDLARGNFIYTASCLFRKTFSELPRWFDQCAVGDYPLHLLNARQGKIRFIDEVMGVYRVHPGGTWEILSDSSRIEKWVATLEIIGYQFDKPINKIIRDKISLWHYKLAELLNGDMNRARIFSHILKSVMVSPFNRQVSKLDLLKIILHQAFPRFYGCMKGMYR